MLYTNPEKRGENWWFSRQLSDGNILWYGPYGEEWQSWIQLENMRKYDTLSNSGDFGLSQNLFDSGQWRHTIQDIFGVGSIEAFPPRGSRG